MPTKTPTPAKSDFATQLRQIAMGSRIEARVAAPGQALFNRESPESDTFQLPADGYFQLLPIGEFPGTMIRGDEKVEIIQIYDRKNLAAMVDSFSGELMVDYEHFSHDQDKATNAAAWIDALQLREDGLYAKARWTAQGKADVAGGNYRYISPELDELEIAGEGRMRPLRLTGAGLTNRPALKTLKPLSNRESGNPTHQNDKTMSKLIAALAPFLALPTEADEATVLNRLSALPEGTTLDALLADKAEVVELRNRHQELLDAQIEVDLDRFESEGVIHDRASVKAMLLQNREGTLKMLEALKPAKPAVATPIYNRSSAKPPARSVEELNKEVDAKAEARAARINNRAQSIMREQKCGFTTAWAQAEQEEPAETIEAK